MDDQPLGLSVPALDQPRSFHGLGRAGAAAILAIALVTGGGVAGFLVTSGSTAASPGASPVTYATTLSATTSPSPGCNHGQDGTATPQGALY